MSLILQKNISNLFNEYIRVKFLDLKYGVFILKYLSKTEKIWKIINKFYSWAKSSTEEQVPPPTIGVFPFLLVI